MLKQYDQIKNRGVSFKRSCGVSLVRSSGVSFKRSSGVYLDGISKQEALDVYDQSTNSVNFRVYASGLVCSREVRVKTGSFPDYVFDNQYKLLSIKELSVFIEKNKHLPGFENANYYIENGLNTSEIFIKQQETIETLTLYIIELEKRISKLEKN